MSDTLCRWCDRPFHAVTRGGNVKQFCSTTCKGAFESAARRYALAMVDAGLLSVGELKRVASENAVSPSRATAGEASTASEAVG